MTAIKPTLFRGAVFTAILFFVFSSIAGLAEARRDKTEETKNLKGIRFDEFWSKATEEGKRWAGDRLYVRSISSGSLRGFDRHDSLSPVWEAQLVKCSEIKESTDPGKRISFCKGKAITLRMAESSLTSIEPGLHIKRESTFRGVAVPFDRIEISAQAAEDAAKTHMRYHSGGYDNYTYDMKINNLSNRPVWIIKKACSARGISEMRCRSKEHWIVKIDAETGEVVK